jgi:hypothetical protein
MAEQGLNHRKFRAIVEHVCSKAVPQPARWHGLPRLAPLRASCMSYIRISGWSM